MPTTTNYGWTTPADTDLVKDGASAIRTLGTAIDTTVFNNASAAISKTIIDAKGDLIAGSAADTAARLAVGTNGQVLKANSATATGLEWGDAGAAATSYTLLNSGGTSLSGSTTTITGLSGYNKLLAIVSLASSSNASATTTIRFNSDTGANYSFFGGRILSTATDLDQVEQKSAFNNGGIEFSVQPTGAGDYCSGYILLDGANSTGSKVFNLASGSSSGGNRYGGQNLTYGGYYTGTSVISSISFVCSTGTYDAGEVFIYGGN